MQAVRLGRWKEQHRGATETSTHQVSALLLSLLIPCIETFVDMDRSWLFDVFERYGQLLLKAVMLLRLRAMLVVCVLCVCVCVWNHLDDLQKRKQSPCNCPPPAAATSMRANRRLTFWPPAVDLRVPAGGGDRLARRALV